MPSSVYRDSESLLGLLEDHKLNTETEIADTLQKLTTGLKESHYKPFLLHLLSNPPLITRPALELLLSSEVGTESIGRWIYTSFPDGLEHFADSLHARILNRISLFLHFSCSFNRESTMQLHELRSMVDYSSLVIQTLMQTNVNVPFDSEDTPEDDVEIVIRIKQGKQRQKGRKADKKTVLDTKGLSKAFTAFGLDVEEIEREHDLALVQQCLKQILKVYLGLLQDPDVAATIQQAYLGQTTIERDQIDSQSPDDGGQIEETPDSSISPVVYPMVQPIKAALYFDSAEGFGEWRILISTRADRDLREARRKDAKFFKIVVKKIKELSNGHFSDDNQKRLNGPDTEIPIYEAKMTRDSRLIYQVDCIPEYDADVERQVIRVFGVYTHAQIDKRLWDSVGYQLGKRGKVYRQRCNFRTQPKVMGDKVFLPACFPPPEQVEEDHYVIPEIPRETLEEIHSVLVLEKFISFSQALLNSIIADLDVAHVFNVSSQEKQIIEYPRSCYVLGRSGTGKTTTMLFKMLGIERAYLKCKDSMEKPRQIFVTQSRVLAGKVEEYFSKLLESLATAERSLEELAQIVKSKRFAVEEVGLIDIDDDENWRGDLPKSFSQLQDDHFPLFITFDHLASLLEFDIHQSLRHEATDSYTKASQEQQGTMVTYQTFLHSYWPHFAQNLTKGLDPALVFSELMGVIEGSEEALSHENRYLDKKTYGSLSHRAKYAFANRRDTIYSIFMMYLKQKKLRKEFDAPDRTHQILKAFQTNGVLGQKIDYLYVDEAQDNLLIDAFMLRSLVRNPDGLFWAGDTAQTISIGSSFRFNDLKAFLFRLEQRREASRVENDAQRSEPPCTFQLAMNYRSHGGIVQCAHSVIELITEFWPYAIDTLSREKGVVDGSKPVFFSGWDTDTVRYEQFLFGESGNPLEFGARQCILVRDESALQELRREVGDIGLIMTLYDSKGLEFDDVLLYKFFEHSTVELSQWRVVLNLLQSIGNQEIPAPKFDEVKHAGVCNELKFLYVAITRARKNLWLLDCSEKSEPMRVFWTSKNEIQNCTPGTDVPRLAVSSTPEEWEKSGRTLFANQKYFQAMHCFERAGMAREAAVAHTYYLRGHARSIQSLVARHAAFSEAAESFIRCSLSANAKEKKAYLRAAGDCFEHADQDFKAADAYEKAEEFNSAAKLYRKCAKFDEAVAVVIHNREHINVEVSENIIDVAKLFYFRGGELEKASRLFDSVEEQLEYLDDFDLDVSKAALLEKLGNFAEAANIHLEEGRTMEAIRLFMMDPNDTLSIRRGVSCVLKGLWEKFSFGMHDVHRIDGVSKLLELASNITSSTSLEPSVEDELSMFQLIKSHDLKALRLLGKKFDNNKQIVPAIMCLEIVFADWPNMFQVKMSATDISDLLGDFYVYCRLMEEVGYSTDPCSNPYIIKLFNIVQSSENVFFLRQGTFLHQSILQFRTPIAASSDQGIHVNEWDLSRNFRKYVLARLATRITAEHTSCREAPAFRPCLSFLLNDHCNRIQCPRQHIAPSLLTPQWFTLQIKIHFQQILLVDILCTLTPNRGEKIRNMRYWIERIYQTMYPEWFSLGGIANFKPSAIPESRKVSSILYSWCHELLYQRDTQSHYDFRLFTLFCQMTKLLISMNYPPRLMDDSFLGNRLQMLPNFNHKLGDGQAKITTMFTSCVSQVSLTSLEWGTVFLQHVLDTKLPIEATVLCELVDHLCGSIVLVRRANGGLHHINLPLSWLRVLLPKLKHDPTLKPENVNPTLIKLVQTLGHFIKLLHSGPDNQIDHLLTQGSNLSNPSLALYRGAFIARVCRAMAFIGYNINNFDFRKAIVGAMNGLKSGVKHSRLYNNYAYVQDWSAVARLVPGSTSGSALDEMIQLYHESEVKPSTRPPQKSVCRVIYKNSAEIPKLLVNPHAVISNLRADAPVFVPRPRVVPTEEAEAEAEAENDVEEPEVDNTEIINSTPSDGLLTVKNLPESKSVISEKQIQAASTLQHWYRRVMKRRHVLPRNSADAIRHREFEACLEEAQKIQWPQPRSFYRCLFLGPLPHVLACLRIVYDWAMNTKQRNKERLKLALHQELEDIQKRLTEQNAIFKEIRRLQNVLKASSELHRKRDIEELKKKVLEVEALLAKIGPNSVQDARHELAVGVKGIVTVAKPPKAKPRPLLRIDDAEDEYSDENDGHSDQEDGEENEIFVLVPGNEKADIVGLGIIPDDYKGEEKVAFETVEVQPPPGATLDTLDPGHGFEKLKQNSVVSEEMDGHAVVEWREPTSESKAEIEPSLEGVDSVGEMIQSLSWIPI